MIKEIEQARESIGQRALNYNLLSPYIRMALAELISTDEVKIEPEGLPQVVFTDNEMTTKSKQFFQDTAAVKEVSDSPFGLSTDLIQIHPDIIILRAMKNYNMKKDKIEKYMGDHNLDANQMCIELCDEAACCLIIDATLNHFIKLDPRSFYNNATKLAARNMYLDWLDKK